MNIPQDDLNEWARNAFRVNGQLLRLLSALQAGRTQEAIEAAWEAQKRNNLLLHVLERAGAENPAQAIAEAERGKEYAASIAPKEVSLELLSSPAACRYASALREVAKACKERERERGIEDGLTEMFEDYAESAELEVYGPQGLRGLE